jgi:hypothetical protein
MPLNLIKKVVIVVLSTLVAASGLFALTLLRQQVKETIDTRIMKCAQIQGDATEINEAAVTCSMDAMRTALLNGTYTRIYKMAPLMEKTNLRIACHQAAHRLGVELLESLTSDEVVQMMFDGKEQPRDAVCTHSLVHGLVQGMTTERESYDLQDVADLCVAMTSINEYYTDECAHYYGHAVWKQVKDFSPEVGTYCAYLLVGKDARGVTACMGGVIMQKYDLQVYNPMTSSSEHTNSPPTYEEIDEICTPYRQGDIMFLNGCMSGVGWLAPTTALSNINSASLDEQVKEYKKALATCHENIECERTFLYHFRVDAYPSGVVSQVCAETKMTITTCDDVVKQFTN